MNRDRRLGRGLAALLGTPLEDELHAEAIASTPAAPDLRPSTSDLPAAEAGGGGLLQLPVDQIEENPFQPRRDFSDVEIASLAESLKEHDMLQPVLVRRVGGRFQLISGERRLRAARHAGWTTIPARVREADDRLVAELAIVENLQRKDLNPIEKALSFKRYLDEHRCTQDDLARRLKIDRSTIANLMRLLELPGSILDSLRKGTITAGHARALLPLGDEHEQVGLARRIETEGLSVRDVERFVAEQLGEDEPQAEILPGPGSKQQRTRSDQVASLEQEFRLALGVKVEIKANSRGRGKLTIHFANHEEFDRLREHLTDGFESSARRKTA
ncbi:MAG: ParB/RepB/Spo0J family partition protein [Planctomycetaceae bacterium]|nr:ParB/RepB/Spo0J family partition protein [Planctomycetaceae bacterium]